MRTSADSRRKGETPAVGVALDDIALFAEASVAAIDVSLLLDDF